MPTTRTYVTKLFLGTMLTLAFIVATPLLLTAALFALPGWLTDPIGAFLWRADSDFRFAMIRRIFFPLMAIALPFFLWRMEKFSKGFRAEKRKTYRRITFLYVAALTYTLSILVITISSPFYKNCEDYTKKLNGGVRQFDGKTYHIQLCGSGPNDSGNHDHIRLRVSNSANSLQAIRYFRIDWDFSMDNSLKYDADGIQYLDFSSDELLQKLYMPPSRLDWMRARIPLLD
ncbi:hypothetical protein EJD96_02505 [Herbaspirillum seropedicae]|uniref:hypothetical protein n=1 Tax=Herbaspirillum seropedicae TaxID=964 RepID=UPI001120BF8F|nr:hypothetical protein [Herbaspirillum seropedicae]QDD63095.1 hypothetical protein EJD96_02505 [Herbaspirillum seropedicae]